MVRKEKLEELAARMEKLGIGEGDLIEKFILGSGKGGQKMNRPPPASILSTSPQGLRSSASATAPAK